MEVAMIHTNNMKIFFSCSDKVQPVSEKGTYCIHSFNELKLCIRATFFFRRLIGKLIQNTAFVIKIIWENSFNKFSM